MDSNDEPKRSKTINFLKDADEIPNGFIENLISHSLVKTKQNIHTHTIVAF